MLKEKIRDSSTGVLYLTGYNNNTVMWGAYSVDANGKSNAGFVIGLDTNHTFFKRRIDADDALRHLVKVRYSGNRQ